MKKIPIVFCALAGLLAGLLALWPITASADVAALNFLSSGTLTNDATRTTGFADVKVDDQEIVGLQVNMQGDGEATGTLVFTIARSKDGSTFETNPQQAIGFALNGNTAVVAVSNLVYVGAAHSLRLISVANTNATDSATNVTISVLKKRVRVK